MQAVRILGQDGERLQVQIHRRPVLERELDDEGRRAGYVRTRQVLETRTCLLSSWDLPSRVDVLFNEVVVMTVSVDTGRAIGNADWVLSPESQKLLRAERRVRYPEYGRRPSRAKPPLAAAPAVEEAKDDARAG